MMIFVLVFKWFINIAFVEALKFAGGSGQLKTYLTNI